MAPEQGRSPDPLTPAADLYALGCALVRDADGTAYKRARPGTTAGSLPPGVPGWFDKVLAKRLPKNPSGPLPRCRRDGRGAGQGSHQAPPRRPGRITGAPRPPVVCWLRRWILLVALVIALQPSWKSGRSGQPAAATTAITVSSYDCVFYEFPTGLLLPRIASPTDLSTARLPTSDPTVSPQPVPTATPTPSGLDGISPDNIDRVALLRSWKGTQAPWTT